MRRLTEEEMAHLCALARQGRHGPDAAMRALWDLIMREAEGVPAAQDAEPFWVQDYSIAADQNETIRAAMLEPRKLPKWQMDDIHMMWVCYSPADHDPVTDSTSISRSKRSGVRSRAPRTSGGPLGVVTALPAMPT